MTALCTHLSTCPMHVPCANNEAIRVAELMSAQARLFASAPSARFAFLDLNRELVTPTIEAVLCIAGSGLQRLAVYDPSVQICGPTSPGTLSSLTFDSLTDLEWTVGFGMNVFNLRVFMNLLPLLPRLRRLSIGPDYHAPHGHFRFAANHSPASFALPAAGYPFRLTTFSCNFMLNNTAVLLILASSASTLRRLSLHTNAFELKTLVPHFPHLPALTDIAVLTANRLVPRAVTEALLRCCPRVERVHLRTNFGDLFEVAAVADTPVRRLRVLKLSSLHEFSSDDAAERLAGMLRTAMPKLRRIECPFNYSVRSVHVQTRRNAFNHQPRRRRTMYLF